MRLTKRINFNFLTKNAQDCLVALCKRLGWEILPAQDGEWIIFFPVEDENLFDFIIDPIG